jgi:hypothetical protein
MPGAHRLSNNTGLDQTGKRSAYCTLGRNRARSKNPVPTAAHLGHQVLSGQRFSEPLQHQTNSIDPGEALTETPIRTVQHVAVRDKLPAL